MKKLIFGIVLIALLSLPFTVSAGHGSPGVNSYNPIHSIIR